MDVLTQCHATWNKPRFLAFLVGLAKWTLVTFPPPVKMVNTPEYRLKQGTEGLRSVIKDILETRVIKPTIPPFQNPMWTVLKLAPSEWHLTTD